MDNLGFENEVGELAFSMNENSTNTSARPHLLSDRSNDKCKLGTSSSFNLPKNKYRRFSETLIRSSDCPQRACNHPSSENMKCSSDNNCTCSANCLNQIPSGSKYSQRRSSDAGGCIGQTISTPKRRHLPLDEFQPNNLKICSYQMNFHASVLNNVQECVSVPSSCVNNSFLNSMPSIAARQSSSLNNKNLINDTSIDILKTYTAAPNALISNNMYANSTLTNSYLNNKNNKFLDDDSVLNYFSRLVKSQNNVNKMLNRATTLPAASKNNHDYFSNQSSEIETVSGRVAMFYPGYQQASPKPCAQNRQNMRRSSKILRDSSGGGATLNKRSLLRGWKLQFIPNDHSKRRTAILWCLLLGCLFVLAASLLVVYMTTAIKSSPMELGTSPDDAELVLNVVAGEFRIMNEKYEQSLKDENSADFKQLATRITQQLDILFSASSLSLQYNHSQVSKLSHGFGKKGGGGILVHCKLVLTSTPPHGEAANLAGLEFLRGLRHHQGQMWLGNFVVDIQSIGFVAVVDTESISTESPDPALIPGWSVWSSWSQCTTNTQMRTRMCRLNMGSGAELTSIEPCLLLEHPGSDLEVRDCEHNDSVLSSRILEEVVTMQSPILKRTTDSLHNTSEANKNNPAISVMDLSLSTYRHCDECVAGEVCVALSGEEVPTCREAKDSSDPTGCGGLCAISMELCHKLDVDAFRCLHDTVCLPNEWQCGNQLCIPQLKRCDGHLNCYDHTDEYNCDCDLLSHFHCGSSTSCLPLSKQCDGVIDCWDGSDELSCTTACPGENEFTCTNGQCIPHVQFCDGFADCADRSDEPFGCGGECKNHEWKCGNGRCIKKANVCDGNDNCSDGTDEKNCPVRRMRH